MVQPRYCCLCSETLYAFTSEEETEYAQNGAEERLDGLGWLELVGDEEGLEQAADVAEALCD
jgi:hypothetical protein